MNLSQLSNDELIVLVKSIRGFKKRRQENTEKLKRHWLSKGKTLDVGLYLKDMAASNSLLNNLDKELKNRGINL